jgi:hypothetical protein
MNASKLKQKVDITTGRNYVKFMQNTSRMMDDHTDEQLIAALQVLLTTGTPDKEIMLAMSEMNERFCTFINLSAAATIRTELETRLKERKDVHEAKE